MTRSLVGFMFAVALMPKASNSSGVLVFNLPSWLRASLNPASQRLCLAILSAVIHCYDTEALLW